MPTADRYRLYARWTSSSNRATNAKYEIYHDAGTTIIEANHQADGGQWVELGVFDLSPGSGALVKLDNDANDIVSADAVRLVRTRKASLGTAQRVYLDNLHPDVVRVGSWTTSTWNGGGGRWGPNYEYAGPGTGTKKLQWPASVVPVTGRYRVYAWWNMHPNRASNTKFRIYDSGGVQTVTVNQEQSGGQWVELGVFDLVSGAGTAIEITDDANEAAIADGVLLVHDELAQSGDEVVVDNTDTDVATVGTWTSATTGDPGCCRGSNAQHSAAGSGENVFKWLSSAVPEAGQYRVFARWTTHSNRATNAKYKIFHDDGTTTVTVNQEKNGGPWNELGVFNLTPGTGSVVELSNDANEYVIADAIRLLRFRKAESLETVIMDNLDSGVSTTGTWTENFTQDTGCCWGISVHNSAAGIGDAVFGWPAAALPVSGRYRLYARWTSHSNRATNAKYVINHDGGATTVTVNQRENGGNWAYLGQYDVTPGVGALVELSNDANGYVIADAIKAVHDGNTRHVVADAIKIVPNTAEDALYVHADHLGTPQKMTDHAAAVVWDATYRPFGTEDAITGTATNEQRFPGQFSDAETGLHYNYFRNYDPAIGRYMQSDPLGLAGGLNAFIYARANPSALIDPYGLVDSPPPMTPDGRPAPPPVPLPPGKNGEPNDWVPIPGSAGGSRDTKWKPKYPIPSESGSQPGASWDPHGHWDVDDGKGGRGRYDPNGVPVDHDGNPLPEVPESGKDGFSAIPRWAWGAAAGAGILGVCIFAPQFGIPALIIGGGAAAATR